MIPVGEVAVERLAATVAGMDTGDLWDRWTCTEIETLVEVLRIHGHGQVAEWLLDQHAAGDTDPEDTHHRRWQLITLLSIADMVPALPRQRSCSVARPRRPRP